MIRCGEFLGRDLDPKSFGFRENDLLADQELQDLAVEAESLENFRGQLLILILSHAAQVIGIRGLELQGGYRFAANSRDVTGHRYHGRVPKIGYERYDHARGQDDNDSHQHPFEPGALPTHEIQHKILLEPRPARSQAQTKQPRIVAENELLDANCVFSV